MLGDLQVVEDVDDGHLLRPVGAGVHDASIGNSNKRSLMLTISIFKLNYNYNIEIYSILFIHSRTLLTAFTLSLSRLIDLATLEKSER